MTESNSINNLLKVGMTKDEFIKNFNSLKDNKNEEASIFTIDNNSSAESFWNKINTNSSDDVIDEKELAAFAGKDTSDGENTISEKDYAKVYNEIVAEIQEQYKGQSAEQMYNNNVTNGSMNCEQYLQQLSKQIEDVINSKNARQLSSKITINKYQNQIDELVANSKSLSAEFKAEYKKASDEVKTITAEQKQNESSIETKSNELANAEGDEQDSIRDEYDSLVNNRDDYSTKLSKAQSKLEKLTIKASEKDSTNGTKISALQNKINMEKTSLESDIANFNATLQQLDEAQDYASSQYQTAMANEANLTGGSYSDEDTANFTYDSKALKEKWQKKAPWLSDEFYNKVTQIAQRLGCNQDDLMAIMYSESGLKSTAVNKSSGATGLIQFMPSVAGKYGTSTAALKNMSAEEQLNYVEQYLQKCKSAAGFRDGDKLDAGTLYTLVFTPAYAHKEILADRSSSKTAKYYNANKGLDANGDGYITKAEMGARVKKYIPA